MPIYGMARICAVKEWRKQLELFTKCGGEVLCTGPEGAPDGYAFVWCSENANLGAGTGLQCGNGAGLGCAVNDTGKWIRA